MGLVKGRTNQAPIKGVYSKYQGATTKEENAYINNQLMEELKRNSQVGPELSLKGVSATNALSVSIPIR